MAGVFGRDFSYNPVSSFDGIGTRQTNDLQASTFHEFEALGTYTGVLHRHITDIYNFLSASYNNEFCAECAECAGMRKKYCSFYDLHNILIICVL
jgi:hypothetical protein